VATAADFRQAQSMIDAVLGYARLLVDERPRPAHHYACLPGVRRLRSTLSS
jgi:hypothetical protein